MGLYKETRIPRDKQNIAKCPVALDKELHEKLLRLCTVFNAKKSAIVRRGIKEMADKYLKD